MKPQNNWVLPEGVEDILPPQAAHLDNLCRQIIDLYVSWGYQLVITPMIEYVDSLLTGTGKDMDMKMFKLIDQISGQLVGIRADITPQVARIDAHRLNHDIPTRLCYAGMVLHTHAETMGGSRNLLQIGAELYGHEGVASDAEILCLMVETLNKTGIKNIYIDLSHARIYNHLIDISNIDESMRAVLSDVLERKSVSELSDLISAGHISEEIGELFKTLVISNGPVDKLQEIRALFNGISSEIEDCLDELQDLVNLVSDKIPAQVKLNFDLTDSCAYLYHTGIFFTAYIRDHGQGIAFGGRYDGIGRAFGRARPATGFSLDIKTLFSLAYSEPTVNKGIHAPQSDRPDQIKAINDLRNQGEIVICELPGQNGTATDMGCDRQLVFQQGKWVVINL